MEEIEEIERVVAGLRSQAMQQVRRFLAMLARMRKDLTPGARANMIKELGWHLGPNHESGGAGGNCRGPEQTWLLEGTSRIMSGLAYLEQQHQAHELYGKRWPC